MKISDKTRLLEKIQQASQDTCDGTCKDYVPDSMCVACQSQRALQEIEAVLDKHFCYITENRRNESLEALNKICEKLWDDDDRSVGWEFLGYRRPFLVNILEEAGRQKRSGMDGPPNQ